MWDVKEMGALNNYTKVFDKCGAYDMDGETAVEKGSTFKKWDNALNFIEEFGVPEMDGFGIIIIDDSNPKQYEGLKGIDTIYLDNEIACYNNANIKIIS